MGRSDGDYAADRLLSDQLHSRRNELGSIIITCFRSPRKSTGKCWGPICCFFFFCLSLPFPSGWVGKSGFAMIPVRVHVALNLACALSYLLLEKTIIHSSDCDVLKAAVDESRKELWTISIEVLALALSFIPGAHYASCTLPVVAVAAWIIPDLRMKRVFEESRKTEDQTGNQEK